MPKREIPMYLSKMLRAGFDVLGLDVRLKKNVERNRKEEKRRKQLEKWKLLGSHGFNTILDIGANEGQFASIARHYCPDARIVSFEPIPECYIKLKAQAERLGNMVVHGVALGASNGVTQLNINEFSPSSSLLPLGEVHREAFPFAAHTRSESVEIRRLDEIDDLVREGEKMLVKIDVQGAEWDVINGGSNVVGASAAVIVEMSAVPLYKGQRLFADVYLLLHQLGFDFRGVIDQLYRPRDGQILQFDGLFLKSETR